MISNAAGLRTHISVACFITLIFGGASLSDSDDKKITYVENLETHKLQLFELRDYLRDKSQNAIINQRNLHQNEEEEPAAPAKRPKKLSTSSIFTRLERAPGVGGYLQPRTPEQRSFAYRLNRRIDEHRSALKKIAKDVHGGSKTDFLKALTW